MPSATTKRKLVVMSIRWLLLGTNYEDKNSLRTSVRTNWLEDTPSTSHKSSEVASCIYNSQGIVIPWIN